MQRMAQQKLETRRAFASEKPMPVQLLMMPLFQTGLPIRSETNPCPLGVQSAARSQKLMRYGGNPHQSAGFYRTSENRIGVATRPSGARQATLIRQYQRYRRQRLNVLRN